VPVERLYVENVSGVSVLSQIFAQIARISIHSSLVQTGRNETFYCHSLVLSNIERGRERGMLLPRFTWPRYRLTSSGVADWAVAYGFRNDF
jgi:hypothetical protein